MLPALEKKGDLAVGQQLFTNLCSKCHTFNGAGGKLGPELSGIGTRDPKEILADIIDPNRSVEANYRAWTSRPNRAISTQDALTPKHRRLSSCWTRRARSTSSSARTSAR
jgi:putative heme-binding domain-containing protein